MPEHPTPDIDRLTLVFLDTLGRELGRKAGVEPGSVVMAPFGTTRIRVEREVTRIP